MRDENRIGGRLSGNVHTKSPREDGGAMNRGRTAHEIVS